MGLGLGLEAEGLATVVREGRVDLRAEVKVMAPALVAKALAWLGLGLGLGLGSGLGLGLGLGLG